MRGLAPRHLRTAILSFFVHAPNWPQTAPRIEFREKRHQRNCAHLRTIMHRVKCDYSCLGNTLHTRLYFVSRSICSTLARNTKRAA
nr:MAG TPA: hypothetical protein [Caudoviricetes sp.]